MDSSDVPSKAAGVGLQTPGHLFSQTSESLELPPCGVRGRFLDREGIKGSEKQRGGGGEGGVGLNRTLSVKSEKKKTAS